jgi:hypothetical protein
VKDAAYRRGERLVGQVDVGAVVVLLLDQVNEPDCVVGTRDRSAVLGLDGDVVSEPVFTQLLPRRERAERQGRAHEHPVEGLRSGGEVLDDERGPSDDFIVNLGGSVAEVLHEARGAGGRTQRRVTADDEQPRVLGVGEARDRAVDLAEGSGERPAGRERGHHHVRAGDDRCQRRLVGGVALDAVDALDAIVGK